MLVNINFLYISKAANSVLRNCMTSWSYMDIHVNYAICHSYVVIGVTQKTKAVCKAKAVSSYSFILRPPTAWVVVRDRRLGQRPPRSAVKPTTRLLNNQIHKAKWKLDTTLHKTVLLSEAKIKTIATFNDRYSPYHSWKFSRDDPVWLAGTRFATQFGR